MSACPSGSAFSPQVDQIEDNVLVFRPKGSPESQQIPLDVILDEIAFAWVRARRSRRIIDKV